MAGKTFIFVVLSGLCFLPASFHRVYIPVDIAKTWPEALSYCREKYTDLAVVDNSKDLEKLLATVPHYYYPGYAWIGLYNDINWRWSLEMMDYYGEGEAEFRMWNSDEPSDSGGNKNCVGMDTNGSWNDLNCNIQNPFTCYNAASSSFIFVNEPKTWNEAQSYCRRHYTDLASVRNQAENDQIKSISQNQVTWIGLHRVSWGWTDGSPTSFRKWNTHNNEPIGNADTPCVLLHEGQMEEYPCATQYYFLCQTVTVRRQLVKVKLKESSVNQRDVVEAILQQFTQTLNDHGLTEDTKLTLRKQPDGKIFYLEEKKEKKEIGCNLE